MRTLDRYIATLFIKNFTLAVVALAVLFMFQALLGDLLDHNYSAQQVMYYHSMAHAFCAKSPSKPSQSCSGAAIVGDITPVDGVSNEEKYRLENEAMQQIRGLLGPNTAAGETDNPSPCPIDPIEET